ncbi:hypothetical protein HYY75_02945 [bacterium]|nr:hypothetical protein [bacterium]
MWSNTTLHGLDEALAELKKAIDCLSDDPIKRQLSKRFQKLIEVRDELDKKPEIHDGRLLPILIIAFLFGILFGISFFLRQKPFNKN